MNRTRATKAQKKATKPAGKAVFEKMKQAAMSVVMHNRGRQYRTGNPEYVLMEVPHWCVFKNGFPNRVLMSKQGLTNTYKVNAVKLLDWLYEQGHSEHNSASLVKMTKQFEYFEKSIDRLIEIS